MQTRDQFLRSATAAVLATGAPAFATAQGTGYTVEGSFDLGGQGSLRSIRFAPERGIVPVRCLAAMLPRESFAATLVQTHERSESYNAVPQLARSSDAVVAINGGFFDYDTFTPDGLLIVDGKHVSQLRSGIGGVATIDNGGGLSIAAELGRTVPKFAVQGRPLLVLPGGKFGMRSENGLRARRSFIAQTGDTIIAGITSPVTLYHLADVMIQYPDAFGVQVIDAALNLTGDATSAFYAKLQDGSVLQRQASWPNLDVLLFTRRNVT